METKTDISYGVIPIRRVAGKWEVFLIHQFSRIGNNTYWILPKGHAENDETPLEAAVRELQEETGLVAERILSEPSFTLQYSFVFDAVQILKTVKFFIGVIPESATHTLDENEVKEAGWYSLADAAERLEYQDTKQMFAEARAFIELNQNLEKKTIE
jgi:8-oxo-dGTP pyrophosphatase MutT (NUDIX family)